MWSLHLQSSEQAFHSNSMLFLLSHAFSNFGSMMLLGITHPAGTLPDPLEFAFFYTANFFPVTYSCSIKLGPYRSIAKHQNLPKLKHWGCRLLTINCQRLIRSPDAVKSVAYLCSLQVPFIAAVYAVWTSLRGLWSHRSDAPQPRPSLGALKVNDSNILWTSSK